MSQHAKSTHLAFSTLNYPTAGGDKRPSSMAPFCNHSWDTGDIYSCHANIPLWGIKHNILDFVHCPQGKTSPHWIDRKRVLSWIWWHIVATAQTITHRHINKTRWIFNMLTEYAISSTWWSSHLMFTIWSGQFSAWYGAKKIQSSSHVEKRYFCVIKQIQWPPYHISSFNGCWPSVTQNCPNDYVLVIFFNSLAHAQYK